MTLVFNNEGQRFRRVGLAVPLFGSVSTLRAMVAEEGKLSPDQVRPAVCRICWYFVSLSSFPIPELHCVQYTLTPLVHHKILYCTAHTHSSHNIVLPKKNYSCIHLPGSPRVIANKHMYLYPYSIKLPPLNTLHLFINGNYPHLLSQGSRCYCAARNKCLMTLL